MAARYATAELLPTRTPPGLACPPSSRRRHPRLQSADATEIAIWSAKLDGAPRRQPRPSARRCRRGSRHIREDR